MKTIAAFFGSAAAFALVVLAWPDVSAQRAPFWEILPWALSILLWALGAYHWLSRTNRAKWIAAVGSVFVLVGVVVSNFFVALTVSCIQGLCL